ncbi:protein kinase domain [Synechococcus sp. PCC 7335]|nr:protein kinase domain [Synechococcus sp. PCC 7335]
MLGIVGQGQFAQVYCAVYRRTGRLVAIKQVRHAKEKFSQEAAIHKRLDHPNIVKCHTASSQRLILDYSESGTLRSQLATTFSPLLTPGYLSFSIIKTIIADILQGLDYLHHHGIVHSDLKPENILLTRASPSRLVATISDFGCAHFLDQPNQSTTDIGSPFYAAPERFDGHSSIASDLYSVGVMLYELLVGDRPFSGTPQQLYQAHHAHSLSFPATLSASAQQLLLTALHKEPKHRFSSAIEMLSAFQALEFSSIKATVASSSNVATITFCQRPKPLTVDGITAPVDALIPLPQGCGIVSANSLHILTRKEKLISIARFRQSCWISVSPTGRWFVALPKTNKRKVRGMIGKLYQSGHKWSRAITPTGRLMTSLLSNLIQVIAIDARYFLQIRTAEEATRTYIECFTRRGQFIGELRINQTISQIVPTAMPYQLLALGTTSTDTPVALLINLKPFQVRTLYLPFTPLRIHPLAWGYLIVGSEKILLLDHTLQPVTWLKGLPNSRVIASLDNRRLLLANHATRPSLSVSDTSTLNLGLIF